MASRWKDRGELTRLPSINRVRDDISVALTVWKQLLEDLLGERLEYAYAKGSAIKTWDSPIDYVPCVSDLDIHVKLTDDLGMFPIRDGAFSAALALSERYETGFLAARPDNVHVPRTQIMLLNDMAKESWFVAPRLSDVRPVIGEIRGYPLMAPDAIRQIDLERLLALNTLLNELPMKACDRSTIDLWTLVRQMTWNVSPTPVRVLTQYNPDPLDCWSWNRTRVCNELLAIHMNEVADACRAFYVSGWKWFLSGLRSSAALREMIRQGYSVLNQCYSFAETRRRDAMNAEL